MNVAVERSGRAWTVRVEGLGEAREYCYRSEAQARFFAAVFALGPTILPVVSQAPKRRKRAPRAKAA